MNIFLRQLIHPQQALSLIELLVALTILVLLSMAGLKMFQSTQTSVVDGRTSLVKAKRNEAIADPRNLAGEYRNFSAGAV